MTNSIQKKQTLNFTPLIAFVLSDKRCHENINKIYKTNELQFNIESKKSKYYNCFSSGSAVRQLYYRRILGILESELIDKEIIYNLLKKYYKYEYTYCYNLKLFKMTDYMNKLFKKFKGIITINELNNRLISIVAICIINEIEIDKTDKNFINFIDSMKMILDFEKDNLYKINYTKASQEDRNICFKQLKRLKKEKPYLLNEGTEPNAKSNKNKLATELLFDIFNTSLIDLSGDIQITDSEILSIIYCYLVAHEGIIDNIEDLDNWLDYTIKIAYMLKAYNESKEYIINNNNEELLLKVKELKNKNDNLNNELNLLNNKINSLEIENKTILNENNKLKLEIEKLNKDKQEINGLREYIFNNSLKEDTTISEFNLNDIINKLSKLDVIVIGGSLSWINRIKEVLPNWTYIPSDSINFDIKLLKNKYILFNTGYVSHSMYYRVIENIDKAKQFNFFSGSTNISLSIKKIYDIYYRE